MFRWMRNASPHLVFKFPKTKMVLSNSSINMMSNTNSWVNILVSASVLIAKGLTTIFYGTLFILYYFFIFQIFVDLLQLLFKFMNHMKMHHLWVARPPKSDKPKSKKSSFYFEFFEIQVFSILLSLLTLFAKSKHQETDTWHFRYCLEDGKKWMNPSSSPPSPSYALRF